MLKNDWTLEAVTPYKILLKFASRSRPEKFFASLDNIQGKVADSFNYDIVCSLDKDDVKMNTPENINKMSMYTNCEFCWGVSKNKIDAINRDMEGRKFDILINMSDDMVWKVNGFDNLIREAMLQHHADLDGVLHFNDGTQAGDHLMTMSIMGKAWYDRFGYIYHPDYTSLWCDNEATEVASRLGKRVYFTEVLFNHVHPGWGKIPYDEQYQRTESHYQMDKVVFDKRKANNFDLK
jgi:hypothetical protein